MFGLSMLVATQLTLAAADVTVVIARQEGVSKKQTLAIAAQLIRVLKQGGVSVDPVPFDALSCSGKKLCLFSAARQKRLDAIVWLEVASVLDDGVIRAEGMLVSEDGKRLGLTEYEGSFKKTADIDAAFKKLVPKLKDATSSTTAAEPIATPTEVAPEPKVTPPAPVEVVKKTEPTPVVTPVVAPAPVPAPSGLSAGAVTGLVMMGVGGAAALSSIYFGAEALRHATEVDTLCGDRAACTNAAAVPAYKSAEQAQTTGFVLVGAGAALAIGGLVVFVTQQAPATPKVSVFVGPSGVATSLSLVW